MPTANLSRVLREQLLQEAEGYLDLTMAFADMWELSPLVRDRLAKRAVVAIARLETSDREQPYALYIKGQALRAMECYSDAVAALRQVAELEPDNTHAWLALGWCYKRLDRLDLAIEALEEAMSVDSRQAIVHYNLACYWSLSGNRSLALAYLERALDIDPTFREMIAEESDFDAIRQHPSFLELTSVVV